MAKSYNIKTNVDEGANLLLEPYAAYLSTPSSKLKVIKSGLPSDSLQNLITLTGANRFDIAQMLSLTEPTLRKYINEGKNLNSGLSEHVLLLFELFEKGIDTFGSLNSFNITGSTRGWRWG